MRLKDIPVVTVGPGSQPAESDGATLNYIDMPSGMATYRRPTLDVDDIARLAGARSTMDWLMESLAGYREDAEPRIANLTGIDDESRQLINELLGEGEVSASLGGRLAARSQESVLTGVWRTFYLDEAGGVVCDLLEVADVPHIVRDAQPPTPVTTAALRDLQAPDGVINATSIVAELAAAADDYRAGDAPHVVNLSLLPMSDEDVEFLDAALGKGRAEILSRSYGRCVMSATAVPNVWWVRYFNSMGTSILNSVEVTDVPQVARAAPEDIADSAHRLADLLELQDAPLN